MGRQAHFVLDRELVSRALAAKGYDSFGELAKKLGLHRNTVGNYLTGGPVIPTALERVLLALDLTPAEAFTSIKPRRRNAVKNIVALLDELSTLQPNCTFVLFGSRARGKYKRYSDYDLGVYSDAGFDFSSFSRLLDSVSTWNANNLSIVQLTNLCDAPDSFLSEIKSDLLFLCGSQKQWEQLLKHAGVDSYE